MLTRIFTALVSSVLVLAVHGAPALAGPTGPEFRVNQILKNAQFTPAGARLTDGATISVWTTVSKNGETTDIKGRFLGADGKPQGDEFFINTFKGGNQDDPSVTALPNGGFMVTWSSFNEDGSGWGVYGRRFSAQGLGSPVQRINTTTDDNQILSSVATLSNGGFVVTWVGFNQGRPGADVFYRVYTAQGNPIGRERRAHFETQGDQTHPCVTGLDGGGFVISFTNYNSLSNDSEVLARMFNNSGRPLGLEFRVNTETESFQVLPAITSLPNDRFVIAWQSFGQDGDLGGIFGQRFSPNGTRAGGEFQLNTHTENWQENVVLAPTQNGFVAAWNSWDQDANGIGVFGRLFGTNGVPDAKEFRINTTQVGDQTSPSIAGSPQRSGVMFFWQSAKPGEDLDIYGRPYDMGP